jgi:hypothetical protein
MEADSLALDQTKRWWWLGWTWRIACASYAVGFLTFLPYQMIMIWWSALLFTPLVIATLHMTRSPQLARIAIPVVAAAISAAAYLLYSGMSRQGLPDSPIYGALWLVGVLGPFVLFFLVSRHLKSRQGLPPGVGA